jgi:DNA polymerase-4
MGNRAVCHLNIVGFKAAVAAVKDKCLQGRPYVIATAATGRSLALDCSQEAIKQGIMPGMTLAIAEKKVKDLQILSPDIPAYEMMNLEIEKVISRYAPVWENDRAGNLYLDISGTTKLFGPPVDCGSRIMRDILEQVQIKPAAAVACNKLVSKVATRTIRPTGLIQVQAGTETEFLCYQDIRILPGMGPKLLKIAAVTGIREIGEVAALSVTEALSIFGKMGPLLRNMALGIDTSLVEDRSRNKSIIQQVDFNEDVIEKTVIRGAIGSLAGHGGLLMRRDKLGTSQVRLITIYSDGVRAEGQEKARRSFVLDREISQAAERIFQKTVVRRLRVRSMGLSLEGLVALGYEPDLFEPETCYPWDNFTKNRKLQEAADDIQNRFGLGKLTRGLVLAASLTKNGKRLLTTGSREYAH